MGFKRIRFDKSEVDAMAARFADADPEEVIAWALGGFGDAAVVVTGMQAEGMIILDMACRLRPSVRALTVDTGRLPQETYAFIDRVRDHYPAMRLRTLFPDHRDIEAFTRENGVNPFYNSTDLRMQCCNLRKVRPLARGLENADAWFAGLRRDQSSSRSHIKKVELDYTHGGIVKLNPLADWTKEDVWAYVREYDVPYHPLYEQGYPSIGCGPCTRATYPGEDDRAGRWWWEIRGVKECGIHFSPVTGRTERSNGAFVAAMS